MTESQRTMMAGEEKTKVFFVCDLTPVYKVVYIGHHVTFIFSAFSLGGKKTLMFLPCPSVCLSVCESI